MNTTLTFVERPTSALLILGAAFLLLFAASVAFAQTASSRTDARVAPPPEANLATVTLPGNQLLERSIAELDSRRSVSARIRQRISLFDHELVGSGTYLEQHGAEGTQFRLELKIQLGDQPGSLLQICDGRYVWTSRQIFDDLKVTRMSLERVYQALQESGEMGGMRGVGDWPGLGGLPNLVRGLYRHFDFPQVDEDRLTGAASTTSGGIVHIPVWRLHGTWKSDRLDSPTATPSEELRLRPASLPPHAPDRVVLFIGKDDLFPYRIEFHRRKVVERLGGRRGVEDRELLSIDLYEVTMNVMLDPSRFEHQTEDLGFSDVTDDFVRYAMPLIGSDWPSIPLVGGLQRFTRFERIFAETQLTPYLPE